MRRRLLAVLPPRIYLELKYWNFRVTRRAKFEELQNQRTAAPSNGYSYKPFDEKKAIFVHVPKCAGVAINKTLFGNLAGGHTTFDEYLHTFEPKCFINYFKFTVVRNPWDRFVSAFFFLRSGGMDGQDRAGFVAEFGDTIRFGDFVKTWVNRTNIWRWHQFRPQYHYILERHEKVRLDFVAFLENIDDDFPYIASRIGVTRALRRSNNSSHSSYMEYYDDETRDIIAKAYAEDIKLLGYTFDNSSLAEQLLSRRSGKIYSLRP